MVGRKVLSLWIVLPRLVISQKQCFRPSGIAVTNPVYQPCIQVDGVESMCCRLNDTNPDTCHPNGLCMATQEGDNLGYWRDFCTDSTWRSPNCLRDICTNEVRLKEKGVTLFLGFQLGFNSFLTDDYSYL